MSKRGCRSFILLSGMYVMTDSGHGKLLGNSFSLHSLTKEFGDTLDVSAYLESFILSIMVDCKLHDETISNWFSSVP